VPKDFYPDIVKRLRAAGWRKVAGGKASHEKWVDASGRMVTVPRSKSRDTANDVLKQAGLPKAF
jgi:predicted RNA binding protein YcfA (HicA-like mRNA interferase family)